MKNIWLVIYLLTLSYSGLLSAQTVFSWVDEKGVIHYTDKAPTADVRLSKRFMEFEVNLEPKSKASDEADPLLADQPESGLLDEQSSNLPRYANLTPSCRWIAKRVVLLEALMEQHSGEYDRLFELEASKRQQDWLKQGCFSDLQ